MTESFHARVMALPMPEPAVRWERDLPLAGGGYVTAATYYNAAALFAVRHAAAEIAAEADALAKAAEGLRVALRRLVDTETKAAGLSASMYFDRAEFDRFMEQCESECKEAAAQGEAALAAYTKATGEQTNGKR